MLLLPRTHSRDKWGSFENNVTWGRGSLSNFLEEAEERGWEYFSNKSCKLKNQRKVIELRTLIIIILYHDLSFLALLPHTVFII